MLLLSQHTKRQHPYDLGAEREEIIGREEGNTVIGYDKK